MNIALIITGILITISLITYFSLSYITASTFPRPGFTDTDISIAEVKLNHWRLNND
jgi:hypothetical protein